MNRSIAVIASLVTVAALACKKDEKKGEKESATAPSTKPAEPAEVPAPAADTSAMPAPFGAWDMPARTAAWQGAMIIEPSLGFHAALEVKGATARQWDGTKETAMTFALKSPCEAVTTEHKPDGSSEGSVHHYTIKGGTLMTGLGDAGSRKGPEAIACVSNEVFTVDAAGKCTEWSEMFDKWESKPGTCGFAKDGDKEVFKATANGMENVLLVDGDALMSEQLAKSAAPKFPDFEAAKAARK